MGLCFCCIYKRRECLDCEIGVFYLTGKVQVKCNICKKRKERKNKRYKISKGHDSMEVKEKQKTERKNYMPCNFCVH